MKVAKVKRLLSGILRAAGPKKGPLIVLLAVLVAVANPLNLSVVTSLTGQEFFTYHVKDLADYIRGEENWTDEYYLATGTYEKEKDGQLFGVAKGKNLIIIQMESFQNMMIGADYHGQEITPVLNHLIREEGTIYFDNFYSQIGGGNTSDAELAVNNSMFGAIESFSYQLFQDNYFKGLPWLLREEGYGTAVMHGFRKSFWNRENIYPKLGIQKFYSDEDYISDNIKGIGGGRIAGIRDSEFFRQSVEHMKKEKQPFYNMLITLSTHNPFMMPEDKCEIKLKAEDKNIVGNYINSVHYADKCIGEFLEELKDAGLYDESLIVMYGDHFGLSKADPNVDEAVSRWLGYEYTYDNMANIPLIMHIPGYEENETISISGGQVDILPTLAYLMGMEKLDTLYMGQNLLTAEEGFVPLQIHMIKGSFVKDDVVFQMSRDGVFGNSKAWNRKTRKPVSIEGLEEDYKRAKKMIEVSHFYLYNDVIRKTIKDGKTLNQVIQEVEGGEAVPKRLTFFYADSLKEDSLSPMVDFLSENPKAYVLLSSDDILTALSNFERLYSGKAQEDVGITREVDRVTNEKFKDMKSRVVPLVYDTRAYSKVEYMEYGSIVLMPDFANYTDKEIVEFMKTNKPYGLLVNLDQGDEPLKFAKEYGDLASQLYGYSYKGLSAIGRLGLKIRGISGVVVNPPNK